METHLGRELEAWEQVDHINDDPTDNRLENLQILSQGENNKKATEAFGRSAVFMCFTCPVCGDVFTRSRSVYTHNQIKQGKDGPFCSKSCAGKMHH